jgi:hypothetical protein
MLPWRLPASMAALLGLAGHFDLPATPDPAHGVGELGVSRELMPVEFSEPGGEPAAASEQLVRKADHARVRPRLRPNPQQPFEQTTLVLVGVDLGEKGRHGGGRAGDSHVTMDQQVTVQTPCGVEGERAPEGQNGLDVADLRQRNVRPGLDGIMEVQDRPMVRFVGQEGLRIRPIRIENGQHVCHARPRVELQVLEAADRQDREVRLILMDTRQTRISRTTDANPQLDGTPVVPTHLPVEAKTKKGST